VVLGVVRRQNYHAILSPYLGRSILPKKYKIAREKTAKIISPGSDKMREKIMLPGASHPSNFALKLSR
jgi:hypothetical protein